MASVAGIPTKPGHVSIRRLALLLGYMCGGAGYLVAMVPFALWCTAAASWCAARAGLGYWPTYQRPKPSDLAIAILPGWFEEFTFVTSIMFLAVGVAWAVQRQARRHAAWVLWMPAVLAVAWGAAYVLLRADPGGILDWWMD